MFNVGEQVDLIGTSKGKGFAGVMKRHGFHGGQRTHGQSDRARAPGSIGPGTTPGRVLKGTRMAGRMGNERVTVKTLEIVQADPERNLLVIKGSVPGPNGGMRDDSQERRADSAGRAKRQRRAPRAGMRRQKMPSANVYDMEGQVVREADLDQLRVRRADQYGGCCTRW